MLRLCIVSIVIGIVSLVGFVWTLKETEGLAMLTVISAMGILLSLAGLREGLNKVFNTKTVSYDFPANEYILEYKVVIIGEKCDTTYMLTKIKTD